MTCRCFSLFVSCSYIFLAHLLPTTIVLVDRLPLTVNGKVDPAALGRATVVTASGSTLEAPKGPLEWRLARIWTTVLGTERVSVTDSFFDLGGNSLQAMRLVTSLRTELAVDADVTAVFLAPTPAQLTVLLRDKFGLDDAELGEDGLDGLT